MIGAGTTGENKIVEDSSVQPQRGKEQENGEPLLLESHNAQAAALNPEQLRAVTSGAARIAGQSRTGHRGRQKPLYPV